MDIKTRSLDIEKILFFDIETVSRNKELDPSSKEFELYAWSIRDKTTGFIPPANEVKKHYELNAALSPVFNKVVTVSVGFVQGTSLYYKAIVGTQKEILEEFYKIVRDNGFKLCGHNVIGFDLPVLRIKSFEEGIDFSLISDNAMDVNKKPWELDKVVFDTMGILKGTYFYPMSLDSACMLAGIESSKYDISGPQVTKTYYQEGVKRVAEYCNKDVIATVKLFCALQGRKDYITNFVDRSNFNLKEKEVKPLLKHILETGVITEEHSELIKDFSDKNGLKTEHVITLLSAGVSYNSDTKNNESISTLKDTLQGKVVSLGLDEVIEFGNLSKKLADNILSKNSNKSQEEKEDIVRNLEMYLTNEGKINQSRCAQALKFIKIKWKIEDN